MQTQLKRHHFYLIETAKKIIDKRFKENRHHFAAAIKLKDGRIFTGLQLKCVVPTGDVCAEAVAIATAIREDASGVEAIVSVNRIGEVISPCGRCRELIIEYCPEAEVIMPSANGPVLMPASQLLPGRKIQKSLVNNR